jgi:hypothetical protein
MNNQYIHSLRMIIFIFILSLHFSIYSQVSYTWTGSVSSDWSDENNWTPLGGPPAAIDHVVLNAGANDPILAGNTAVTNFTINANTFNLNGFTLSTTGTLALNGGTITNGTFSTNTANNATLAAVNLDASASLTVIADRIFLHGGTYSGPVICEQTGGTSTSGTGNALFNNSFSFTLSGAGYFRTNGNHTFNGPVTLINNGSNYILLELTVGSTYNSTVNIVNNSTANIRMAYTGASIFNGNIEVTATNTGAVIIGELAASSVSLGAGVTINVGAGGFVGSSLQLRNITQADATNQSLTLSGTAILGSYNSVWSGNVSFIAPRIITNSSTYNGTAYLEKTGITDDASRGGNIFNNTASLVHSGANSFRMGGSAIDIGDQFNGVVNLRNTGTGQLELAYASAGNVFNNNITIESTGSLGLTFGGQNGTSTLADTRIITVGGLGFDSGTLLLRNFTQVGTTPQAITLTGTALLSIYDAIWNGNFTVASPRITTRGTTYNGVAYLEKTGAGDDNSRGGNTFNNDFHMVHSSTNVLRMSSNVIDLPDTYNGNSRFTTTGGGSIRIADYSVGNLFNGNILVESVGSQGVRFGETNGSSTLADTRTITVGGLGFDSGTLSFRNFTQLGTTTQNLVTSGTSTISCYTAIWNGDVNFTAPQVITRETVYEGITTLHVNGSGVSDSYGLNTFNGATTLINSGTNRMRFATTDGDTFNGPLTLSNTGSNQIWMADNGGTTLFNNNVTIESVGSNGILFGRGGSGFSELADTYTISVGGLGFDAGSLSFRNFTQIGGTAQSLTLTNTAYLLNNTSEWNGNVNFIAPRINTFSTTYNGAATLEKSGAINDQSTGLNVFNQNAVIRLTGSGYFGMGQTNPDTFNADLTVENLGDSYITIGQNSTGNVVNGDLVVNNNSNNQLVYFNQSANGSFAFNGNIEINSSTTANGIRFGETTLGTGTITFAAGNNITIGGGGFHRGELRFVNFNQIGSEAINLALDNVGTGYFRSFESNWNGDVTITSPRITTRGSSYNGTTHFEKNGITDDASNGGNTFNDALTIINNSANIFRMGNLTADAPDIYNGITTLSSLGNSRIQMAFASLGNEFNNDVIVESTGSTGVTFGEQNGTSTLADTRTITVGGLGFDSGTLLFRNFTQLGSTAQNITLTGTGLISMYAADWNATVNFTAPQYNTRVTNYRGITTIEKNGAINNDSYGGNIFHQATSISQTGDNNLRFAVTSGDIFNGNLTLTNTGIGQLRLADAAAGTAFNENISVQNTSTGAIHFGLGNGTSTLADTKTITIGGLGFNAGILQFRNFTQLGATPQAITLTGTALLSSYDATWNAPVTFISPQLTTRGSTYNEVTYLEKNGATNNASTGGNTFNADVEFVSSGTGYFMPANNVGNDFNVNVTYTKINTGFMYPTYNATSTYAGDITINSNTVITFGDAANGRVLFDGSGIQNIINSGVASNHIIERFSTNKGGGEVVLQTPIVVTADLNLIAGNVITDATNLLIMNDNSTVSAVSDAAYVSGPMRKVGNDAFDFPVGKGGVYRPISISAPTTATHHFTAEFFNTSPDAVDGVDPAPIENPMINISDCEYWILDRTNGASNVNVTLSYKNYGSGCSGVDDPSTLAIARWDGGTWRYHEGTAIGAPNGSIITNAPVTSFSPFALASTSTTANPLPVELISFEAQSENDYVVLEWVTASEINNDFYTVEKSYNGYDFIELGKVVGAGNSSTTLAYSMIDENPYSGESFYRLRQTDFDGTNKVVGIAVVQFNQLNLLSVYPNPAVKGNQLLIELSQENVYSTSIQLVDGLGRILLTYHNTDSDIIQLETSNLSPGIYYIKANMDGREIIKKIIIQ